MSQTIDYYNENATAYVADTLNVDFDKQRGFLLKYLKPGAKILDLGCGSGRDSKKFIEKGFSVVAVDGSTELCKLASQHIGQEVRNIRFDQLDYENEFDAVWACASLLHLTTEELKKVFPLIIKACKSQAFIYMSFKYGDFEGIRNGRFFNYMNEDKFQTIIQELPLKVIETEITGDVRDGRATEKWFNIIMKI